MKERLDAKPLDHVARWTRSDLWVHVWEGISTPISAELAPPRWVQHRLAGCQDRDDVHARPIMRFCVSLKLTSVLTSSTMNDEAPKP